MQIKRKQIEALIKHNLEVFKDAFLMEKPSDEDVKKLDKSAALKSRWDSGSQKPIPIRSLSPAQRTLHLNKN